MEEETKINNKSRDFVFCILTAQVITVVIICLSVYIVKIADKPLYSKLKAQYKKYICVDTDAKEIIRTDKPLSDGYTVIVE